MDAFLRRVLAQRELEQEAAILAVPVEELAARHCEGCGIALNMTEDLARDRARHFCNRCGGEKADRQRERELAAAARRARYTRSLLELAGVPTTRGDPMADEKRQCPHCGKTLRSDNTRGACSKCLAKGKGEGEAAAPARSSRNGHLTHAQTKKRFRTVAEALGIDGDKLLEQFMVGWLEKIRESVRAPEELEP